MATRAVLVAGLLMLALAGVTFTAEAQQNGRPRAGLGQRCGGLAGIPCARGLWCDPDPGQCFVADGQGRCVNPLSCVTIIIPVCGCDGKTYARDCERHKAGVGKKHEGQCKQ